MSRLGDRLTVGRLALNQVMEVQVLLPELWRETACPKFTHTPGQLLLVATPGSEPGGRWFDSNPRNFEGSTTEVIRPDEEPVLKTGGGLAPLVGSSPTASAGDWLVLRSPRSKRSLSPLQIEQRAHRPAGRRRPRKPETRVRIPVGPLDTWSCGLEAKAALLQSDDRWFESTQDYLRNRRISRSGTPMAERFGLNQQPSTLAWAASGRRAVEDLNAAGLTPALSTVWIGQLGSLGNRQTTPA